MLPWRPHKGGVFECSPRHLLKTQTLRSGIAEPPPTLTKAPLAHSVLRLHFQRSFSQHYTPTGVIKLWRQPRKVIVAGLKADANSCLSRQEFLKKEFSEENILFWQACEYFSQVPATDKKQVKHSRTLIRLWHNELAVIEHLYIMFTTSTVSKHSI